MPSLEERSKTRLPLFYTIWKAWFRGGAQKTPPRTSQTAAVDPSALSMSNRAPGVEVHQPDSSHLWGIIMPIPAQSMIQSNAAQPCEIQHNEWGPSSPSTVVKSSGRTPMSRLIAPFICHGHRRVLFRPMSITALGYESGRYASITR